MSEDSFDDLFANLSSFDKPKNPENSEPKKSEHKASTKTPRKESKPVSDDDNDLPDYLKFFNNDNEKSKSKPVVKRTINPVPPKKEPSTPEKSEESHIALDTPEMKNIKVTRDGKTLEEMLPHLRGGTLPLETQMRQLKNKADDVIINGKKVSDDRYTQHRRVIDSNKKNQDARRKLSRKFVQRNSRYTEDEKIIMTNLGLNMKELTTIMKSPNNQLTKQDKLAILSKGSKGLERYYKGKRFRVTRGDTDMLEFLAKFKLGGTRILSLLRGEKQAVTNRRLNRLKKNGLVADYEVPGLGTVWSITEIGMAITGYQLTTFRQHRPKMSILPPIIGINYVAACLWRNSYNVLFLDDFPANNKSAHGTDGRSWHERGENLISELEIRSSFGKEMKPAGDSSFGGIDASSQDTIITNAHLIWHKWEHNGRNVISPETYPGNEYLWIIFPEGGLTVSFHVPDLVISRPRNADGSPNSIAVECELTKKSHKNYVNTMRAYKEDKYLYKKVIWITNNAAIERRLNEAAKEVGYTDFDIVPFTNESGIYKDRDIWFI